MNEKSDKSHFSIQQTTNRLPQRKSPRANFHNYSGGTYFVTICTFEKKHHFGNIRNGEMKLSKIGDYCNIQLKEVNKHYNYASIPLYVVMPNHIHAIIHIKEPEDYDHNSTSKRSLLSIVVGGIKRAVTMYAKKNNYEFDWQDRYHDHIIRDHNDGNNIAQYIENNVLRWDSDCFFG